jgi:hypothetical protein
MAGGTLESYGTHILATLQPSCRVKRTLKQKLYNITNVFALSCIPLLPTSRLGLHARTIKQKHHISDMFMRARTHTHTHTHVPGPEPDAAIPLLSALNAGHKSRVTGLGFGV